MLEHIEKSVVWAMAGIINSVFAMKCLSCRYSSCSGEPVKEVEKLIVYESDKLYMQPCVSPVWDTAWTVNAFTNQNTRHRPGITKGGRMAVEQRGEIGDWALKCMKNRAAGTSNMRMNHIQCGR